MDEDKIEQRAYLLDRLTNIYGFTTYVLWHFCTDTLQRMHDDLTKAVAEGPNHE